jgi:hypothetical protein
VLSPFSFDMARFGTKLIFQQGSRLFWIAGASRRNQPVKFLATGKEVGRCLLIQSDEFYHWFLYY